MMLRRRIFIVAGILASCTLGLTARAQGTGGQSQPPPSPSTTAGIARGAAASDADIESAVALFCPQKQILRDKNGKISGCKTCPKGTEMFGTGVRSEWELRSGTMWGHFTSSIDDNLLVTGFGCDSHANNFGGSYVFTRKAGKLRILKYDPALFVEDCHVFPFSDGRDFLVCKSGWFGQGEGTGYVYLATFDATGEDKQNRLFVVKDTTGECGANSSVAVQASEIKDIKFATKENGELTGMTVTATLGNIRCNQRDALRKGGSAPSPLKTYVIEFTFDGKLFHVTPESKAALTHFEQD
jgi:hypothetical protein